MWREGPPCKESRFAIHVYAMRYDVFVAELGDLSTQDFRMRCGLSLSYGFDVVYICRGSGWFDDVASSLITNPS